MASQGREELFHKILVFFAVITAITGIFNLASSGGISLGNLGTGTIPGQITVGSSIPGGSYQDQTSIAAGTHLTGIDFTTADPINSNVTIFTGSNYWDHIAGTGLELKSPLGWISMSENGVFIKNIIPSNGNTYTVNYLIENENQGDFTIFPRARSGSGYNEVSLVFKYDGIHVKSSSTSYYTLADDYFYGDNTVRNTLPGGSTITTILTEATSKQMSDVTFEMDSTLTVVKDGVTLFTTRVSSIYPEPGSSSDIYRAGLTTSNLGFIVKAFPSTETLDTSVRLQQGPDLGFSDVSGDPLTAIANFIGAIFSTATGFLNLLGQILGLTSSAIVPFWLWAIIALPCLATLVLIYLEMIRGN